MIYNISIWLLPVLIAVTFHEAAHGFVARSLGDETASRLGRVSLNPFRHIDPFGTILLPGLLLLAHSPFLFGYAKPVPVNFRALRHPRSGMVLVAAAGPAMNIGLAIVAALSCCLEFPPYRLSAGHRRSMGRVESKERHRHQCRSGGLQFVSPTTA
jgi:Zn-dependent protease